MAILWHRQSCCFVGCSNGLFPGIEYIFTWLAQNLFDPKLDYSSKSIRWQTSSSLSKGSNEGTLYIWLFPLDPLSISDEASFTLGYFIRFMGIKNAFKIPKNLDSLTKTWFLFTSLKLTLSLQNEDEGEHDSNKDYSGGDQYRIENMAPEPTR